MNTTTNARAELDRIRTTLKRLATGDATIREVSDCLTGLDMIASELDNKANYKGDLIIVAWSNLDRMWTVSARASDDSDWSAFEGAEDELDTLMSLARDVATGG